jgi:hypothetical protein
MGPVGTMFPALRSQLLPTRDVIPHTGNGRSHYIGVRTRFVVHSQVAVLSSDTQDILHVFGISHTFEHYRRICIRHID